MSWIWKIVTKMKSIDPTDVLNQQFADEIIKAVKEVLL